MSHPLILLIDNNFQERKAAALELFSHDIEVIPASKIREAMAVLRVYRIDLIVCDMHLPDGDADHLLQTVKSSAEFNQIPVVVVSSRANDAERVQVLQLGAAVHLVKDDANFSSVVRETLKLHKRGYEETSIGISGQLARMKIVDLIAHLAGKEGSGLITIDGDIPMEIHLRDGQIVHARHGITVGVKALQRCLRIAEAAFHFVNDVYSGEPSIVRDLPTLLEEARVANEKLMANYHHLPKVNNRIRVLQTLANTNLKPEARASLEIARKYPRIGAYLDRLNLPDMLCYEYLITFIEKGYVELVTDHKPVCIITDEAADLPADWLGDRGLIPLPLYVEVNGERFTAKADRAEGAKIYERRLRHLEAGKVVPPDETFVRNNYLSLLGDYDCLSLFSGLPEVVDVGHKVQDEIMTQGLNGKPLLANEITTLNTHAISIGTALLVRMAKVLADERMQIELIEERLLECMARLNIVFVVQPDASFHVRKSKVPVVVSWLQDGFEVVDRVEAGASMGDVFLRQVKQRVDRKTNLHIALGHIQAEAKATEVQGVLSRALTLRDLPILPMGPVVGRHLGMGAIGLAFFQE